ncbi:hypothetical protein G9A89_008720 [Geosiphon pyriformis]|nr:hypothetical protein G9A89_008720 [Geosiphon pyriformis]
MSSPTSNFRTTKTTYPKTYYRPPYGKSISRVPNKHSKYKIPTQRGESADWLMTYQSKFEAMSRACGEVSAGFRHLREAIADMHSEMPAPNLGNLMAGMFSSFDQRLPLRSENLPIPIPIPKSNLNPKYANSPDLPLGNFNLHEFDIKDQSCSTIPPIDINQLDDEPRDNPSETGETFLQKGQNTDADMKGDLQFENNKNQNQEPTEDQTFKNDNINEELTEEPDSNNDDESEKGTCENNRGEDETAPQINVNQEIPMQIEEYHRDKTSLGNSPNKEGESSRKKQTMIQLQLHDSTSPSPQEPNLFIDEVEDQGWNDDERRRLIDDFIHYFNRKNEISHMTHKQLADEIMNYCKDAPHIARLDNMVGKYLLRYYLPKDPIILNAIKEWTDEERRKEYGRTQKGIKKVVAPPKQFNFPLTIPHFVYSRSNFGMQISGGEFEAPTPSNDNNQNTLLDGSSLPTSKSAPRPSTPKINNWADATTISVEEDPTAWLKICQSKFEAMSRACNEISNGFYHLRYAVNDINRGMPEINFQNILGGMLPSFETHTTQYPNPSPRETKPQQPNPSPLPRKFSPPIPFSDFAIKLPKNDRKPANLIPKVPRSLSASRVIPYIRTSHIRGSMKTQKQLASSILSRKYHNARGEVLRKRRFSNSSGSRVNIGSESEDSRKPNVEEENQGNQYDVSEDDKGGEQDEDQEESYDEEEQGDENGENDGDWTDGKRRDVNDELIKWFARRNQIRPTTHKQLANELKKFFKGSPMTSRLDKQVGRYLQRFNIPKDPVVLEAIQEWIEGEKEAELMSSSKKLKR